MEASIGLQLHSVREEAEQDVNGVLERVARIGYLGVEVSSVGGLFGMRPEDFRRRLDELGLVAYRLVAPRWPRSVRVSSTSRRRSETMFCSRACCLSTSLLVKRWHVRPRV